MKPDILQWSDGRLDIAYAPSYTAYYRRYKHQVPVPSILAPTRVVAQVSIEVELFELKEWLPSGGRLFVQIR